MGKNLNNFVATLALRTQIGRYRGLLKNL